MENTQNSNTKLKVAIGVMAAIIALLAYLYFAEKQNSATKDATIDAKTHELVTTNTKLDSISTQLDEKIAEIKMLGGNVEELEKVKAQLEADKRELKNIGNFNLKKYETKIKNYELLLTQKDAEIVKLKEENHVLSTQNEGLNRENTGLKGELGETKQKLNDSVALYSAKNQELSSRINAAAILKAEGISVDAISARGKERDGGSYKAKKIDKIRIVFSLSENALAKKENKEVFMRMLDPDGAVLSDMATGSGAFMAQGKEIIYTAKTRVFYNNVRQMVDVFYQKGSPYRKGIHTIEIYCDGYKVGQGDFEVR
jgi:UDP-N-acetyl-D-mannosaminuronic acid transferase (WecB/TagA/CpsF family)